MAKTASCGPEARAGTRADTWVWDQASQPAALSSLPKGQRSTGASLRRVQPCLQEQKRTAQFLSDVKTLFSPSLNRGRGQCLPHTQDQGQGRRDHRGGQWPPSLAAIR